MRKNLLLVLLLLTTALQAQTLRKFTLDLTEDGSAQMIEYAVFCRIVLGIDVLRSQQGGQHEE